MSWSCVPPLAADHRLYSGTYLHALRPRYLLMVDVQKKFSRSRDFRIAFSNAVKMRIGDNDASLTFVVETDDENGSLMQEDQFQVIMTPKSLKILHMSIGYGLSEL